MKKKITLIIFRYLLLVFLGLILGFFYTPLLYATSYLSYFVLSLFYSTKIINPSLISINSGFIQLIPACIALSAYYLLAVLNLSVPMSKKQRTYSMLFCLSLFFFLNVMRIIIFATLFVSGVSYFDIAHRLTWYFGSTILLIAIWFFSVKIFKIRSIPFYSDANFIFSKAFNKNKK